MAALIDVAAIDPAGVICRTSANTPATAAGKSFGLTATFSCVAFTNVVACAVPFTNTTEFVVKFVPWSVTEGMPDSGPMTGGVIDVIVGGAVGAVAGIKWKITPKVVGRPPWKLGSTGPGCAAFAVTGKSPCDVPFTQIPPVESSDIDCTLSPFGPPRYVENSSVASVGSRIETNMSIGW